MSECPAVSNNTTSFPLALTPRRGVDAKRGGEHPHSDFYKVLIKWINCFALELRPLIDVVPRR